MTEESNIKFVGQMKPQRLTSIAEDCKAEQAKILADQKRFAKYGTNNPKLAALMESGQVIPAVELVRVRQEEARQAGAFEESVQSEQSHSRTRIPRPIVSSPPIYSRKPVDE
jgi:hypothetical protein